VEDDLSVKLHLHGILARLGLSPATELNEHPPLAVVEDSHDQTELGESQQLE